MLSLRVLVAFGKSKIDDVHWIFRGFRATDQEIVWLDVAVDNFLFVDRLDTFDHLNGDEQNCFQVERAFARLKEVFKGGAKQVHDHNVELLIRHRIISANVVEARHTSCTQI